VEIVVVANVIVLVPAVVTNVKTALVVAFAPGPTVTPAGWVPLASVKVGAVFISGILEEVEVVIVVPSDSTTRKQYVVSAGAELSIREKSHLPSLETPIVEVTVKLLASSYVWLTRPSPLCVGSVEVEPTRSPSVGRALSL